MKEQNWVAFPFIDVVNLAAKHVKELRLKRKVSGDRFLRHFEVPAFVRVYFSQAILLPETRMRWLEKSDCVELGGAYRFIGPLGNPCCLVGRDGFIWPKDQG